MYRNSNAVVIAFDVLLLFVLPGLFCHFGTFNSYHGAITVFNFHIKLLFVPLFDALLSIS